MTEMSDATAPLSTTWVIRILLLALILSAFLGGYYNVRFELLEKQQSVQPVPVQQER